MAYEDPLRATKAINTSARIEGMIEHIRSLTKQVVECQARVQMHARTLGFYEPPNAGSTQSPQPVIDSVSSALDELQKEVNHLSGTLNVFD